MADHRLELLSGARTALSRQLSATCSSRGRSAGVDLLRRTFTKRGAATWLVPFATPLDGILDVQVTLPRGGLHEVALLWAGSPNRAGEGPLVVG